MKNKIIIISGATASGKSDLALQIAQELFYSIENPQQEDADTLKMINAFSYDFYTSVANKLNPSVKKI